METNTEKDVARKERLLRKLNEDTAFMLHENTCINNVAHNKRKTPDEVTRLFITNQLSDSDVFILRAVHILGFATPEMAAQELKILKTNYPEKIIPAVSIPSVRNRMIVLSESGLLIGQIVSCPGFNKFNVYCCTETAYSVMRKRLNQKIYGDNFLACESAFEILRKLAATYILLALSKRISCSYVKGFERQKSQQAPAIPCIYSKMKILQENRRVYLVCEPLYFSINMQVHSPENIERKYLDELTALRVWIGERHLRTGAETIVIVCVENMDGLKRAAGLIHEAAPELEHKTFYTSERVLSCFQAEEAFGFLHLKMESSGLKASQADMNAVIQESIHQAAEYHDIVTE